MKPKERCGHDSRKKLGHQPTLRRQSGGASSCRGFEGEWIESIRDRLDRDHVRALECLAHVSLDRGENSASIEASSQAIAIDAYRESSYQLLMRAHSSAGNRAEGVLAYKRLQKLLREDLGVEPSAESEAVYRQLS